MRSRDRGKKLTNVRFLTRIPSFSLLSKGSGSDCGETMKTRIPPRENKPAAMFERIHPTKKRPIYLGRFLIGGVENPNGIEHTKEQFYLHIEITATITDAIAIAKVHLEIIKDFFKIRSFVLRESSFFPMLIRCSTSSIFETIPF